MMKSYKLLFIGLFLVFVNFTNTAKANSPGGCNTCGIRPPIQQPIAVPRCNTCGIRPPVQQPIAVPRCNTCGIRPPMQQPIYPAYPAYGNHGAAGYGGYYGGGYQRPAYGQGYHRCNRCGHNYKKRCNRCKRRSSVSVFVAVGGFSLGLRFF